MKDVLRRNNVNVSGQGEQAMVFVHGFGCDQSMWRRLAPVFADHYRIVLLDLVGAGDSDVSAFDPNRYSTLRGYANDIIEVCRELEMENIIFVGHSVSAMIGALADIAAPALIDKLVMIGPSPCYINKNNYTGGFDKADIDGLLKTMAANYLGWSADMAPAIMGNNDRPELGEELEASFCRTDPKIARHFAQVTFLSDNRADLPKVQAESLVLQCSEDIIAPEIVGRYVYEQIPNSHFRLLKATGHCPHVSAPDETAAYIGEFVGVAI